MKNYETAKITVEELKIQDIITASPAWYPDDNNLEENAAIYDNGNQIWGDIFGANP